MELYECRKAFIYFVELNIQNMHHLLLINVKDTARGAETDKTTHCNDAISNIKTLTHFTVSFVILKLICQHIDFQLFIAPMSQLW